MSTFCTLCGTVVAWHPVYEEQILFPTLRLYNGGYWDDWVVCDDCKLMVLGPEDKKEGQ